MMAKPEKKKFVNMELMLMQGIESRFKKGITLLEKASDLTPISGLEGSSADIKQAIKNLNEGAAYLTEMLVYRKLIGID